MGRRGFLEDGLDLGLPDGGAQSEVAAGEDDEAEHDRGALADLAAVWPLDATELVDAVAEEGDEAPAALARALARAGRRRGAAGGEQVALDLVGRAGLVVEAG